MENEVWKAYPEFPWIQGSSLGGLRTIDRYVTCKNGRKRFLKGQVLTQYDNGHGYMQVNFKVNGKQVHRGVHRIIAACFLPNPLGLPEVNHIDCDRTNNHFNNLEFCTHEYNMQYREKYGVSMAEACGHSVIAVNFETHEVLRFESQHEAARQLGAKTGNINKVIKGKRDTAVGYWFTNADNNAVKATRTKFDDIVAHKVEQLIEQQWLHDFINEMQPA